MIRTDEDEYFIEPLERGKQMEEEKGRIHMVYRRSAVAQRPPTELPDVHTEGTVPLLLARLFQVTPAHRSVWRRQCNSCLKFGSCFFLSDSEIVPMFCCPPSTGCNESSLKAVVLIRYILPHPRIPLCLENSVVGPSENNYHVWK